MEFSRQEDSSGLPFPSPGDLPDLGIEPRSLALQADSLLTEPPEKPEVFLRSAMSQLSTVMGFPTLGPVLKLWKLEVVSMALAGMDSVIQWVPHI